MLKPIVFAVCCAAALLFPAASSARVIEIRKGAGLNPSIAFPGVPGDAELGRELNRFLSVCGWFDPASGNRQPDYTILAEKEPAAVKIYLIRGGKERVAGWRFPTSGGARETAKSVVDTVIEFVFKQLKVRGFCHSRIAFSAETAPGVRNIFLCDIDGGNVEQLTAYRTLCVEPCWTPSGKSICFSKYGRTGIDVVETTVGKPRRSRILSSFRGINTGAAVSPDGENLAVILSPDHQVDLYVLGLRRRFQRRLTRGIAVEASPCWSPDGRRIAFVSDRSGSPRIYIANADGSGATLMPKVDQGVDAVTPAWSGDDKIAYATRIRGSSEYVLAVHNLKTGENRVVTKGGGSWESPEWAADNRQVVCKRTVKGRHSLWIVDTLNGRERELLHTGSRLFDPAWSPCVRR